ncbi:MAG: M28 family peptidase [Gemmatimonadetes bacterium]|nr:M28 family peptidase [Gemmatimonadota bacterium]
MSFLADDLLEGRDTGTRGYSLAARYVASQFAGLGLEPGGEASYEQPVPLLRAEVVPREGSLVLIREGVRQELREGQDFYLAPHFTRERSDVTAPVVFAGYGVTAPELGYDDYAGLDVRGKVVAVLRRGPPTLPPTHRAHHAASREKLANAVSRGAVGVLMMRLPSEVFPWERMVQGSRFPSLRWLQEDGSPRDAFPTVGAAATLSASGAEALFQGAPRALGDVFRDAETGKPPTFDLPVRIRVRTRTRHARLESPNVAGLLRGGDPRLRDEVVVYTAHLDHLGVGEPVNGDSIHNGALDNASGSAALLEIARAFARLPRPPSRSILFLAVTGEEKGLLGSDYFATHPTLPIENIVANVNVDGLGILFSPADMVAHGSQHSSLGGAAERAARKLGLKLSPDPAPEEVFFVRSDQYSFIRQGIPSLFVMQGFERADSGATGSEVFQEWMRTRYHAPSDDMEQPMDLEGGARHAQLQFLIGLEIANDPHRPTWNEGDFFGDTFAQGRKHTSETR